LPRPPKTFALPIWARILLVLGMLFAIGLSLLGIGASIWERDLTLLALTGGILGPMTLGWAWMLRVGLRRVTVSDDAVVVRNLLLSKRAPLDQLVEATHRGPLRLHYTHNHRPKALAIRFLIRDLQTRVLEEVEQRSTALATARAAARSAGVPATLRPQSDNIWTNLVGGAVIIGMMGLLAVAGAVHAVDSALDKEWVDALTGAGMGTLGGLFALLFTWLVLTKFVWRWEFTATHVGVLRSIGWKRYPVAELEAMALRSEKRVMKGVERQAWLLEFRFSGDRTLKVEPTENGLPARFSPGDDHRVLSDLEARLRPVYFPAKTVKTPSATPSSTDFDLAPLADLLAMNTGDRAMEGETIRDRLVALPPSDTPALVAAATHYLRHDEPCVVDVLILALTDRGDPLAWPVYAEAVDHSDEYVRFVAACGLDLAAGERFRIIERCIHKGHIDHDAVDARIPAMKKWWRTDGAAAKAKATAAFTPRRRASPREQRWNFIALNPTWVMEATGPVHQPTPGSTLPKAKGGLHVVGGTIRETGRLERQEAVFELRATDGAIQAVVVKGADGWREVPRPWTEATPRFTV